LRRRAPGEVKGLAADLSTEAGLRQIATQLAGVEILVNNLGIYEAKPFEKITDEDWRHILEVNLMSGVRLSRLLLPGMRQRNWGRIIFISSESAVQIPVEMIHYGVTKTAQIALARGLAETTVGTGITVNSVLAGPTRSEGVEQFVSGLARQRGVKEDQVEKEFFQTIRPSSLLKRLATSQEVASLAVYLASPVASATNGAAVRVDGGVVRSIL
jgi:NAD(P)-dependent dehydrogenase (short-subunit alcohol dehydrogenase family)